MTLEQLAEKSRSYRRDNREYYNAYQREYYKNNKARISENAKRSRANNPETVKAYRLKESYGMSISDYNRLFEEQGRRCAICASETPRRKGVKYFMVDHCHATGKIRGLLCTSCNHGLGRFRDNIVALEAAISYLKKAQE